MERAARRRRRAPRAAGPRGISVVDKCFDVIDAFDARHRERSVTELSTQLGLPLSTVHRLLATLMRRGFVRQDAVTKRYTLSLKLWEKGCLVVNWHWLTGEARAFMEELHRAVGETVTLGVMEDGHSVYVDELQSFHPIGTQRYLGRRVPGHASATGKAMLAYRPDALEQVLQHGLVRFTARTITTRARLLRELEEIRRRGYAVGRGQWLPNVIGVAAPIRDHTGRVVAAISVSSPADRMPPRRVAETGPLVRDVADRLSKELGHVPDAPAGPGSSKRRDVARSGHRSPRRQR